MSNKTDNRKTKDGNGDDKRKIEITIVRNKQFFDMLKEPQTMWRVLLSLFFVTVILVLGLSFVIISVKRFYPYNTIQTNMYGATIMKDEDKEVIYWLFNTAELWANSGIKVKKNDELTIRASGASFTAIHHLIDAANTNKKTEDRWVDTDGQTKTTTRDQLRAKYRIISDNCAEAKLLMMVADENNQNNDTAWVKGLTSDMLEKSNIEIIGKERKSLRIKKDGVLHFAVNDIILTDDVIKNMYTEFIEEIMDKYNVKLNEETKKKIIDSMNEPDFNINNFISQNNREIDDFSHYKKIKDDKNGLMLGFYPEKEDKYPLINELLFYKENRFRDAWFVDNIGSFLIVIERKR